MEMANTLSYYNTAIIIAVKSFIVEGLKHGVFVSGCDFHPWLVHDA